MTESEEEETPVSADLVDGNNWWAFGSAGVWAWVWAEIWEEDHGKVKIWENKGRQQWQKKIVWHEIGIIR